MTTQWQGMITFLGTASLKKTDEFYCSILVFKVFMDQGVCKSYEIPGGGMIGFCRGQALATAVKKTPMMKHSLPIS